MVKNNPNVFEVSTNVVWLFEFSNKQQFLSFFFFNQIIIDSNYFRIRKSNVLNIFEKTKETTVLKKRTNKVSFVIKEKIWKTWSYTKIGFKIRLCNKPILGRFDNQFLIESCTLWYECHYVGSVMTHEKLKNNQFGLIIQSSNFFLAFVSFICLDIHFFLWCKVNAMSTHHVKCIC